LQAEASKPRTDSFEVFGVKFPVEKATRCGILLIVGVQLYLWIHLHELSPKLNEGGHGLGRSMDWRLLNDYIKSVNESQVNAMDAPSEKLRTCNGYAASGQGARIEVCMSLIYREKLEPRVGIELIGSV
jgi:hypothetical protein